MVDTAVTPVAAATMAGSVAVHDMSMIGLFWQADIVVKVVMIALLLASLWCWAIIIEKMLTLKAVHFASGRFEDKFWNSNDISALYEQVRTGRGNPLQRVFRAGMGEWSHAVNNLPTDPDAKKSLLERVGSIMAVARNKEAERLESSLGFLATMGSTAPFIGLFGTVWGIMNSFTAIASQKSTNLSVVAPGIAEALFATAIGLFVAIPAVIGYNHYSQKIGGFSGMMEDFSTEFLTLLSRQLDKPSGSSR